MDITAQSLVYGTFNQITTWTVTLLGAAAVLVFIFGIVKYIFKGTSKTERTKGRNLMIWGIIGIFVMFSVWGIISLISGSYGVDGVVPQFGDKTISPENQALIDQNALQNSQRVNQNAPRGGGFRNFLSNIRGFFYDGDTLNTNQNDSNLNIDLIDEDDLLGRDLNF